jgi:hypothetical protein
VLARAGKGHKYLHEPASNHTRLVLLQKTHHKHEVEVNDMSRRHTHKAKKNYTKAQHTTQTASGGAVAEQLVAATSKRNS